MTESNQLSELLTDPTRTIRVCIVDDHDAIRLGFRGACAEAGFELTASEPTVGGLVEKLSDKSCEVAVLDLSLADGSSPSENVKNLVDGGMSVVIYSIADKQHLVRQALRAGAAAMVPKSHSMDELIKVIRLVADGVFVNNIQTTAAIDSDLEFKSANLSPREREVLSLYASGLALKQVAYSLNISMGTAKEHIDRVRSKYSQIGRPVGNKTELLLRAIEDGIVDEGLL